MFVRRGLTALAVAMMLFECGGAAAAPAEPATASNVTSSSSSSVSFVFIPAYETLLPAEPSMPNVVCATLSATLQQTGGRLPDALDADPANSQPDTARLQAAIDNCPAGQAVKLVTKDTSNAFLAGRLSLKSGVTLWVDHDVTLFASRSPADYDNGTGNCGEALPSGSSACNPWITASSTRNSGIVGYGTIDGRGGSVMTSGHHANRMTWWDLSMQSKASPALSQNNPRILQVTGGSNFTLYHINIQNSPMFHVASTGVTGFIAWDVKLVTPSLAYSTPGYACAEGTTPDPAKTTQPSTCFQPDVVKNTDGIDPGNSTNVTVAYSYISTGDDNIVIKSGKSPASSNHLYAHNHFYYGHGMSIGSETDAGVDNVKVWDLVVDGNDSNSGYGLRIKTDGKRGGDVRNVIYRNVCMRRVKAPMVFSPYYSGTTSVAHRPNVHDITISDYHYVDYAGSAYNKSQLVFSGYTGGGTANTLSITLDNVVFDTAPTLRSGAPYHDVLFTLGPGPVSYVPGMADSITMASVSSGASVAPISCGAASFVKFPSLASPI